MEDINFHTNEESWEVLNGCIYCGCSKACEIFGSCIELAAKSKKYIYKCDSDRFVSTTLIQCKKTPILGIDMLNQALKKHKKTNKIIKPRLTKFEKLAIECINK